MREFSGGHRSDALYQGTTLWWQPPHLCGKERFSAPGNGLDSITRFSAGETTCGKLTLYQGTTLQAVEKPNVFEGYDL